MFAGHLGGKGAPMPEDATKPKGGAKRPLENILDILVVFVGLTITGILVTLAFGPGQQLLSKVFKEDYKLEVLPGKVGVGLLDDADGRVLILKNNDKREAVIQAIVVNGEFKPE